jgi:nitrite reductase (cytochrome c-552)
MRLIGLVILATAFAAAGFLISLLLTNIFERKQEAKNPYVRLVEVTEDTTDPVPWGMNWPREYDAYLRTTSSFRMAAGFTIGNMPKPGRRS